MNVLLSIKPQYVDQILEGNKKFEFRKSIFKNRDIRRVFIYSSAPVKKVVASFEIGQIIEASPQELWAKCHEFAGIPEQDFFDYFNNSEVGYAIEIMNLSELFEPIDPYLSMNNFKAPQSYYYLSLDYFEKRGKDLSRKKHQDTVLLEAINFYSFDTNSNSKSGRKSIESSTKVHLGKSSKISKNSVKKYADLQRSISCKLGDLFEFEYGKGLPKKRRNENGEYPVYGSNGIVGYHDDYLIEGPAIIVGRKGAAGEVAFEMGPLWPIDTTYFVKVSEGLDFKFSYFLLKSLVLSQHDKSTAIPGLNRNDAYNLDVNLPPLHEQRAIVSKIEQLFSELDNGIANLKLAQEQLKVYRQAVLKKAFEGELTKEWRNVHPDIKPISVTIRDIGPTKKSVNYKLIPIEKNNLRNLPDKWEWHSIIEGATKVTVGYVGPMKKEYVETGIPFLRSQNVRENRYNPSGLKYISPDFHEKIRKSSLEPNDLVIVRSGNVGVSCVIPESLKEANCSDLVIIKQPIGFVPQYASYYLNSITTSVIASQKVGVALSHFNTQSVANLPIPLPPIPEQQAIVNEIEIRLLVCDRVEQDIAENLEKAEALRQSILKKAFEGKLLGRRELEEVRSAPDWEPVEVLLERINSEKKTKADRG
jgi:type I restriction enzyme S subunit